MPSPSDAKNRMTCQSVSGKMEGKEIINKYKGKKKKKIKKSDSDHGRVCVFECITMMKVWERQNEKKHINPIGSTYSAFIYTHQHYRSTVKIENNLYYYDIIIYYNIYESCIVRAAY